MNHIFFIHSPVEGSLFCFLFLTTTNKVAMNIVGHVSLLHGVGSFGYITNRGIAGSLDRNIPIFLRNCPIDLQVMVLQVIGQEIFTNISNRGVFPLLHNMASICCTLRFLTLAILMDIR